MTEVTVIIGTVAVGPQRLRHWRPASSIGSKPRGEGTATACHGRRLQSATGRRLLGCIAQRGPVGQLDPGPARSRSFAGGRLDRVDRLPALPGDRVLTVRLDHGFDVVRYRLVQPPRGRVLEDLGHGVLRILLVGSDHAGRAALDPARHVLTDLMVSLDVGHASVLVANEPAPLVELDVADRLAGVSDRAEDELSW